MSSFAERLKEARKAQKLTQKQLAERIGAANTSVSNWELGYVEPNLEQIKKISELLGIDVSDLIGAEKRPDIVRGMQDAEHIKKYRQLSPSGQRAVDALIDELLTYEAGYITDK